MDPQVLIAFLLYLGFFGWVGWRRGTSREGIVLITSLIGWLLLQERGEIFVRFANLGSRVVSVAASGGLGDEGGDPLAALGGGDTAEIITAQNSAGFLFLLWAILIILVYTVTNMTVPQGKPSALSILLGIVNGLLYSAIILPRLIAPLLPDVSVAELVLQAELLPTLRTSLGTLWTTAVEVVRAVQPQGRTIALVVITMVLLVAASSLRSGSPRPSRRSRGSGAGGAGGSRTNASTSDTSSTSTT